MTAWDWTSELIRYGPGRKGSTRAPEPNFPWHGSAAGGARPQLRSALERADGELTISYGTKPDPSMRARFG
jgi:hypothetical protein